MEYWVIIKFDEWPSNDVIHNKSWLVHHATMLSIFERYDPKQASQSICRDMQQLKKFLSTLKEASWFHLKAIFFGAIEGGFGI